MEKVFRSKLAYNIFKQKYSHEGSETWSDLSRTVVEDVTSSPIATMQKEEQEDLIKFIQEMKFIPGGRYLYYAGRPNKFFNNCYLLRAEEDTREDWAELSWKSESCLTTGGGIGVDYSVYRPQGSPIKRTGGTASGPISKMMMINEIGRVVKQGAGRRSAIYASLDWMHPDANDFLTIKNWDKKLPGTNITQREAKALDFDYPCPLDMTNISLNYDDKWLTKDKRWGDLVFYINVAQAVSTGEPGFSFNFGNKQNETLRNACTEVTSEDDSDVCNLGSINFANINNINELRYVVHLATKFLIHGTLKALLPYEKVYKVREKNRRLGLGIMGLHEWLIQRGYQYEVTQELKDWLYVYKFESDYTAEVYCRELSISCPVAKRAIAPTGTIGMVAGTTTGIEPVFAAAYKRRYLDTNAHRWKYQYAVDSMCLDLSERYGVNPDTIQTAYTISFEDRIKFQADIQDYVDQSVSSTCNLPAWGTEKNNEDTVTDYAKTLSDYAPRIRGFTFYPDGARGGQPLTMVDFDYARKHLGKEFEEHIESNDICEITGKGGSCGI